MRTVSKRKNFIEQILYQNAYYLNKDFISERKKHEKLFIRMQAHTKFLKTYQKEWNFYFTLKIFLVKRSPGSIPPLATSPPSGFPFRMLYPTPRKWSPLGEGRWPSVCPSSRSSSNGNIHNIITVIRSVRFLCIRPLQIKLKKETERLNYECL